MNAGSDYNKARRQAQANANLTGVTWVIFGYNGVWWCERQEERTFGQAPMSIGVEFLYPQQGQAEKERRGTARP